MPVSSQSHSQRAAPVAVPAASAAEQRELEKHNTYLRERETVERTRQIRALLVLALVVLALSIARAGVDRVFPTRWWHPW